MKKFIVFSLIVLVISANAHSAAISTSKAQLDWASLTITGDIAWSEEKGSASYVDIFSDIGNAGSHKDELGWIDISASDSTGEIYGNACTSDVNLYGELYTIANESAAQWVLAEADAARYGYFTANSSGLVEFTANYSLWLSLLTDLPGEYANGYVEAGLFLFNEDTEDESENYVEIEYEVWDVNSFADSHEDTLTVSLWFESGESGYFEAWAFNSAEVAIPEPATICLLALGSLISIGRKKTIVCRK